MKISTYLFCLIIGSFVLCFIFSFCNFFCAYVLWFAWKFVPLWYQQQQGLQHILEALSCDLLENSYLCGISNNGWLVTSTNLLVVICLKIRTFVVSATTHERIKLIIYLLWFARKFVPLWYQQQPFTVLTFLYFSCDLLENSYLCGISNNRPVSVRETTMVVICLKIRTFDV